MEALVSSSPSPFSRRLRAGAAALAALLSLNSGLPALAQAPSAVLVITGAREPLPLSRLAADVVVIDAEAIRASSADSVADLLRREAGVQLSRSGGPGQSTGVFLRGAAAVNTVVLVDGVRIGSATLGSAALEGLSLAQIDRIEVLRGPGSSLYGADAVGGVVHIFTRRGTAGTRFDAALGAGGYGAREASAGVRGGSGAFDYAVSLGQEQSRGVSALRPGDQFGNYNPDTDGHRLRTAQAQLGLAPAAGHRVGLTLLRSRLNAQYDASVYLPDFSQDNSPDFRNHLDTAVTALDWRGTLSPDLTASARASAGDDELGSGAPGSLDRFRTQRRQLMAQLAWNSGALGQLVGAVERLEEEAGSSSFVAPVERSNTGVVLALSGAAEALSWQADLRRDDPSDRGAVTTARLGGGWQLTPQLRLRALAGTTFRAPSFNDLVFPGYGVPTLLPERGRSVEAGAQWRNGTLSADATVYRNRVRDLIGYESDRSFCPPDPSYDYGCARNLNRARLQGLTLAVADQYGAFGGTLDLKAQLEFLDAKDELTQRRLPRRAARQGHVAADWRRGDWQLGASLLDLGGRPDGGLALPAETTLDLSAGWRFARGWKLQAKLINATDEDLQPVRDYQGLGRQAWLTLRYEGGW
jgi:vitamin B12 transporter